MQWGINTETWNIKIITQDCIIGYKLLRFVDFVDL